MQMCIRDRNMRGTWLPSKIMTPLMIGQQGACVLNVSSMSAFTPLTRIPGYSGAKAAVSNFTQWLATYLARSGVRVNAIAPGFFMTEQNHALQFNPDGTPTQMCIRDRLKGGFQQFEQRRKHAFQPEVFDVNKQFFQKTSTFSVAKMEKQKQIHYRLLFTF